MHNESDDRRGSLSLTAVHTEQQYENANARKISSTLYKNSHGAHIDALSASNKPLTDTDTTKRFSRPRAASSNSDRLHRPNIAIHVTPPNSNGSHASVRKNHEKSTHQDKEHDSAGSRSGKGASDTKALLEKRYANKSSSSRGRIKVDRQRRKSMLSNKRLWTSQDDGNGAPVSENSKQRPPTLSPDSITSQSDTYRTRKRSQSEVITSPTHSLDPTNDSDQDLNRESSIDSSKLRELVNHTSSHVSKGLSAVKNIVKNINIGKTKRFDPPHSEQKKKSDEFSSFSEPEHGPAGSMERMEPADYEPVPNQSRKDRKKWKRTYPISPTLSRRKRSPSSAPTNGRRSRASVSDGGTPVYKPYSDTPPPSFSRPQLEAKQDRDIKNDGHHNPNNSRHSRNRRDSPKSDMDPDGRTREKAQKSRRHPSDLNQAASNTEKHSEWTAYGTTKSPHKDELSSLPHERDHDDRDRERHRPHTRDLEPPRDLQVPRRTNTGHSSSSRSHTSSNRHSNHSSYHRNSKTIDASSREFSEFEKRRDKRSTDAMNVIHEQNHPPTRSKSRSNYRNKDQRGDHHSVSPPREHGREKEKELEWNRGRERSQEIDWGRQRHRRDSRDMHERHEFHPRKINLSVSPTRVKDYERRESPRELMDPLLYRPLKSLTLSQESIDDHDRPIRSATPHKAKDIVISEDTIHRRSHNDEFAKQKEIINMKSYPQFPSSRHSRANSISSNSQTSQDQHQQLLYSNQNGTNSPPPPPTPPVKSHLHHRRIPTHDDSTQYDYSEMRGEIKKLKELNEQKFYQIESRLQRMQEAINQAKDSINDRNRHNEALELAFPTSNYLERYVEVFNSCFWIGVSTIISPFRWIWGKTEVCRKRKNE